MSTIQKKQHYVWRYHLEAWAVDGSVHWYSLRQKKGGHGSPASLAYGKYFYKSERLSDVDKKYMEVFIKKLPVAGMRDVLTRQLQLFQAPHDLRDLLEKRGVEIPEAIMKLISDETESFDKTIGENWHGGIESRAIPLLDMLRNRDASFWNEPSRCSFFIYFLCHQFFRTPKMKHVYEEAHKKIVIPGLDVTRIWVIETLMYSTILGANLLLRINLLSI